MSKKTEEDLIGAAILGFIGAIRCCHRVQIDPVKLFTLMNDGKRVKRICGKDPYENPARPIGAKSN